MLKKGVFYIGAVLMVGCTTLPDHSAPKEKTPPVSEKKKSESSSGVKITPYDHPEIQRKSLQVIVPQQKKPQRFNDDGSQLPAESLARRGLSFAQSQAMKKQLWLVILKAGQQRNNSKTVQEAQQALKAF